ncbi:MAG: amidohydrolase family protein [Bryobacteraceae bacterium]
MMKFRILLCLTPILLLHAQDPGAAVAIRNVTAHPASGPAIERATIVLRGGLIEAVGANVTPPAGAWIVEGIGWHAYPGLIDSLSHWGIPASPRSAPSAPRPAASPAPTVRGPEDRPATTSWLQAQDLVKPAEKPIEDARAAGFTTAVVYPRDGIFAGQGAVMNLAGDRPGAMVVAAPAGQFIRFQTNGSRTFPGSLMGVIAYVRQIYLDAARYDLDRKQYAANPRGHKRPEYDRALDGVLDSPRILLPASTEREIARMIAFAKELGRPAVLYGGHDAWRAADSQMAEALRAADLPLLIDLKWPGRAKDADPDAKESLRTLERYENAPSGPAALRKANVRFAFYSGGVEKPADLRKAVKRAIDAGLSREDALRALTLSAAEIYGVADRTGSLETGKIANVVVTDGDLFSDRTRVRHIFVDGVKFDLPEPAPESGNKEQASKDSPAQRSWGGGSFAASRAPRPVPANKEQSR